MGSLGHAWVSVHRITRSVCSESIFWGGRDSRKKMSHVYRNSGFFLRRIKYGNRGRWFGPRALPVLREGT